MVQADFDESTSRWEKGCFERRLLVLSLVVSDNGHDRHAESHLKVATSLSFSRVTNCCFFTIFFTNIYLLLFHFLSFWQAFNLPMAVRVIIVSPSHVILEGFNVWNQKKVWRLKIFLNRNLHLILEGFNVWNLEKKVWMLKIFLNRHLLLHDKSRNFVDSCDCLTPLSIYCRIP